MNLPEFSIHRKVTILMITAAIIVFGGFSLKRLELKLLPDISYPSLTIQTELPGATPEDIEKLVSQPMEETLGTVNNLKEITSISKPGFSEVIAEFNWGTSMDKALMNIREKLDLLNLPDKASTPRILRYNPETEPMMTLALTGRNLVRLQNLAENEIKPALETLDGVAAADVLGGDKEEIRINVSLQKMDTFDLSLTDILDKLRSENINMPGGILEDGKTEYLVRIVNEYQTISDIGNLIIKANDTILVRLKDIATIRRMPVERTTITYFNDRPSVLIDIYKEGDANILKTANRIRTKIGSAHNQSEIFIKTSNIRKLLPEDTDLIIVSDQSRFIRAAVDELGKTAVYGCILAVLILFLFLRNLRHTLIISIAIPISIISTFALMYFKNITLNLMSMGGLALGIGMLVDNSIVVLENIFRYHEEGLSAKQAAYQGTIMVATAVTASTLTTIAVFFPIIFVTGFAGQIFGDLAWTIAFSLSASLIVSLSLIPMISSWQLNIQDGIRTSIPIMRIFRTVSSIYAQQERGGSKYRPISYLRIMMKTLYYDMKLHLSLLKQNMVGDVFLHRKKIRWNHLLLLPFNIVLELVTEALILTQFFITTLAFLFLMPILFVVMGLWRLFNTIAQPLLILFNKSLLFARYHYIRLIEHFLSNASKLLVLSLIVFIVIIAITLPNLGMNLIPTFSQGNFFLDIKLPEGSSLDRTESAVRQISYALLKLPEIKHISSVIGKSGSLSVHFETQEKNAASMEILLKEPFRTRSHESYVRKKIRNIVNIIPGLTEWEIRHPTFFSIKTPLEIEVQGTDIHRMERVSRRILDQIRNIPGLTGVYSSIGSGYPEIQVDFDPVKLARLDVSPSDITSVLKTAISGSVSTDFGEPGQEIDIRVQAEESPGWSLSRLENLVINPQSASPVLLKSIARIKSGIGPSEIRRVNHRRVIIIKSDVTFWDLKRMTRRIKSVLRKIPQEPGITFYVSGQSAEMKSSSRNLLTALIMAVFLVYLVMASQFESLGQPLIILLSIPFAFLGVLLVLWLFSIPISVMVFIGMIVLIGIIVNNAIVLIDTINKLRKSGLSVKDAVITASETRFRPILMTMLTTILGLLPMIVERGAGVELRMPLALTVIAGLLSGTFLTLVIIPIVYYRIIHPSS